MFAKLSGALLPRHPELPALARPRHESRRRAAALNEGEAKRLSRHLKALKLRCFRREHDGLAQQCAAQGLDLKQFLWRLAEIEVGNRVRARAERLIKAARFPAVKSLDTFNFAAIPSLDKNRVLELSQCGYIARRESVIAVGNSGTGKTHIALALGLAACEKGLSVGFFTARSLVHELHEAHAERREQRFLRRLGAYKVLIIDELGYMPLAEDGAQLLLEVFNRRCGRGSTIVTSNLPVDQWSHVFGSEQVGAAVLGRLGNPVHLLDMHGESYRVRHGRRRQTPAWWPQFEIGFDTDVAPVPALPAPPVAPPPPALP